MKKRFIACLIVLGLLLSQSASIAQNAGYPLGNGNLTWVAVTCGTTSTPFGVTAKQYMTIHVPGAATNPVWMIFGYNATTGAVLPATTAPPSQDWPANSLITWGSGTGSCIVASGTQAISVGYF